MTASEPRPIGYEVRADRPDGVSVCICTAGRVHELERCLESIRDSSAQPAAVYISDDSHSSEIAALGAKYDVHYSLGPARGLCANRNSVVAQAATSHVTLIDDDGVFGPNFIRDAIALLPTLTAAEIVSGTVIDGDRRIGPTTTTYLGFFTATSAQRVTSFNLNANLIPRGAFDLAAFDERIEFGYEDMDLAAGLMAHGFVITYMPHLANFHLPPGDVASPKRREREVERARYLVALKRRSYRHRRPRIAQACYALAAGVHSVAHAAKTRASLVEPIHDMAHAWSLATRSPRAS